MRSLLRDWNFLRVWFGQIVSNAGDWFTYVALIVRIYDMGGGATAVAGLLVAQMGSALVVGQFAGVLLDRVNRRRTMIAVDLLRAAAIFAAVFAYDLRLIYLLVFTAGVGAAFFQPALHASLPNMVKKEDLEAANSLVATTYNAGFVLGPAAGGIITGTWGTGAALACDSATFALSALAVAMARMPQEAAAEGPLNVRAAWDELVEGFMFVRRRAEVLAVVVTLFAIMVFSGLVNVVEVYFARDVLGAGERGFGYMVSAWGAGMIAGSFLVGFVPPRSLARFYLAAILTEGIGVGLVGLSPGLAAALAFLVVGGFGNGAQSVAGAVMIQRTTPDRFRGRALATRRTLGYTGWVLSLGAGGFLPAVVGLRTIYIGVGAAHLGVVALGRLLLRASLGAAASRASGTDGGSGPSPVSSPQGP